MSYASFALVGAGLLGSHFVEEFAKSNAKIRLLSRSSSKEVPKNVEVRQVDYTNEDSIVNALDGIEVVISTLGRDGFQSQPLVIKAAAKAGVKLFVPSEYGVDTTNPKLAAGTDVFKLKVEHVQLLKSLNLPYTLLVTGYFSDVFFFFPPLGFDLENKKVSLVGKGDTPSSFTTTTDIARFAVHVFTTQPKESLHNKVIRIEGDVKTFNQVIDIIQKSKGIALNVEHIDTEQVREKVTKDTSFNTFLDYLKLIAEDGGGKFSSNDNALYPDWNPSSVETVLNSK